MPNFFAPIVEKFKLTGELVKQTLKSAEARGTAQRVQAELEKRTAPPKPAVSSGNLFKDVAERFNIAKPQELYRPIGLKPEAPEGYRKAVDATLQFAREVPGLIDSTLNLPGDIAEEQIKKRSPEGSITHRIIAPAIGLGINLLTPGPGEFSKGKKLIDEAADAARLGRGKRAAELGTDAVETAFEKEQARIRAGNRAAETPPPPSGPSGLRQQLKESLAPVKELDPKAQGIFQRWTRNRIAAKEAANREVGKIGVSESDGLNVIKEYEAGRPTVFSEKIRKEFDGLLEEARKRGLDIPRRDNYIPHVFMNPPAQVDGALSRYLKQNPSFSKARTFPDYETAMKYGLTPKYTNPDQLLAHYREELETALGNRRFLDELVNDGRLLPADVAPSNWQAINLPFSQKGFYAEPKLAHMLNGLFRDEGALTFGQQVVNITAKVSKKMQEIALSAGVPKTNVNFFSIGQFVKQMTAGDVGAITPFIRANFNGASIRYFKDNQDTLRRMAGQGIDLGDRIGSYGNLYKNLAAKKTWGKVLGTTWDKLFNEKTFGSFMPQLYTQTFKGAFQKGLRKGMSEGDAETFAAEVTRNMFGLFENVGRSADTEDFLSAVFFAPKFREGIIRTLTNTAKSVTTEARNPVFFRNRRLFGGMVLTYGLYNALNKHMTGHYMWENEPGKEFDLKIPLADGQNAYLGFMPSFLAFARNIASGAIATATGDFATAGQKFGSVFSMPVKITSEVLSNRDYFGRAIYDDADSTATKLKKIALYAGLQVNHPFVEQLVKQITTDKPLYQSVSEGMELPFKFNSQDAVSRNAFYRAMDEQELKRKKETDRVRPTYEKAQAFLREGRDDEAKALVKELTPEDYEIYKALKSADKRRDTMAGQAEIYDTVIDVQKLLKDGKEAEARAVVKNLSEEEYRHYQSVKKKLGL